MAEIKFNNLYNQLKPMDQMFYDQQFSKNYTPGQENIRLSSQPAYEEMKAAYEAEQEVPETGIFDSIFSSASAAGIPQNPNLVNRSIAPKYGISNLYDQVYGNLTDQINARTNQTADIMQQAPTSLGFDTSFGVANEPDVDDEEDYEVDQFGYRVQPSGIEKLIQSIRSFTPLGMLQNFAGKIGKGPSYQTFSPGTSIRNGIVSIAGVNTPYSMFAGDFFDPATGLNRFDRAKTTFGKSRTLADFFNRAKEAKAAKKAAVGADEGVSGDGRGSRRGDADISDDARGGFGTDDTAGFF